jgi:hypothetical protein
MDSCFPHEKTKKISDDHAKKSLNRPGEERRAELEEKEIDESVKGSGMSFRHIITKSIKWVTSSKPFSPPTRPAFSLVVS